MSEEINLHSFEEPFDDSKEEGEQKVSINFFFYNIIFHSL